jgi:SET domain-containing protein
MLLVKTFLKESTIVGAGIGCFANEFISAGTQIWKFNPYIDRLIQPIELKNFSILENEFIKTYSFMHNGFFYLCADNARFFNHSIDKYNTLDPVEDKHATYAKIDINIGEEIISNYGNFGITEEDKKFNLEL